MGRVAKNTVFLTDAFASTAVCPEGRRFIIFRDTDLPGFCLRVMATGTKAWIVDRRSEGQRVFGEPAVIRAGEARVVAEEILSKALPKKAHEEMTLLKALDVFKRTQDPAVSYLKSLTQTISIYGGALVTKAMARITREEAVAQVEYAWNKSPRQGDLFRQYAHRLYTMENLPSPFANIKKKYEGGALPFAVPAGKWKDLLESVAELRFHGSRDAILTSIYTGFRPLAICQMTWDNLRLDKGAAGYFIGPRSQGFKRGKSWWYPLPEVLADVLRNREKYYRVSEFIFYSPYNPDKPMASYADSVESLSIRAGIPELLPYHLRDTRATYAERFFGNTIVTQRLLNHRPDYVPEKFGDDSGNAVTANKSSRRYVETTDAEIRSHVERLANVIQELAGLIDMTDPVRRIFLEGAALSVVER
jgi:integrase